MCNTTPNPATAVSGSTGKSGDIAAALSEEIQIAKLRFDLAQVESNAEYNASPAGQIQRQFESLQRSAKPYAESTIVPTIYRGNIGNCVIAIDLAHRMALPALTVMQNLCIINGNPSWYTKFLVASINTCGRYTTLRYRKRNLGKLGKVKYNSHEWVERNGRKEKTIVVREFDATGIDNWECVAYAIEKSTGETLESDSVTIEMAIKEGWYTKDGSKWPNMPMLMLSYRAAAFWQRIYAPEMSMGFRTVEEERDITDVEFEDVTNMPADIPVTPKPSAPSSVEEAKEKLRNRAQKAAESPAPSSKNAARPKSKIDMP